MSNSYVITNQSDLSHKSYVGRFAPAPTGPLHFGSLIAALASYLDAKHHHGLWLLRIDDIDKQRCRPHFYDKILASLNRFGLHADGETVFQQKRIPDYNQAIEQLVKHNLTYPCYCSRQQLRGAPIYPGTCREAAIQKHSSSSLRITVGTSVIRVEDGIQGWVEQHLADAVGDFNIKRRDNIHSYHLATVVDDAFQGVNHIVRGCDLLDSTPRQIYLQEVLDLATPAYLHVPIAVDADGNKFSKQNHAPDIDEQDCLTVLIHVLDFLAQKLPPSPFTMPYSDLLKYAIVHWDSSAIPRVASISVDREGKRIKAI